MLDAVSDLSCLKQQLMEHEFLVDIYLNQSEYVWIKLTRPGIALFCLPQMHPQGIVIDLAAQRN